MKCDITLLGPFLSKLPAEILLKISLDLCASSQREYPTLLLISRAFHNICRLTCLPVISITLETEEKAAQFTNYLIANEDAAPFIRRLWITKKGHHGVISKCTNLVALACDGLDLMQIATAAATASECGDDDDDDTFQHNHLVELTVMGLWESWGRFWQSKHAQVLCAQLEKLWLLDHLTLQGMKVHWLSSLKELLYWSIELHSRTGGKQFKKELELLDVLPGSVRKLTLVMFFPPYLILARLQDAGDPRLEVVTWGERSEAAEWADPRVGMSVNSS